MVSLTVSLIAVLIPLLFMSDVVGRLFSEFAVTLSVTILISAVVSLTLVPMMCAQLLRQRDAARPRRGAAAACRAPQALGARWFGRLIGFYDRCLIVVFRHQPLTLLVAVGTIVLTVAALYRDPQGLLPGAGHRPDPGRHRGAAERVLRGDGRAPARAGRRPSWRIPTSRA